jgi:hypothetical protein
MTRAPHLGRGRGLVRLCLSVGLVALAAGCAQRPPHVSYRYQAEDYAARARGSYPAPGPASDPWGPFIVEAAAKYDVPERWIREVMRQESGGRLYENGELITSGAGAMGLMQVMPVTYEELRQRYGLGDDPFDPHDNIMAGTAYIREMYDVYGSPGFLAAYNAGPKRLDDYLNRNRPLPDETRHYVASIGPNIAGVAPSHPSQAQQYAMNSLPMNIPPGPRYPRGGEAPVAVYASGTGRGGSSRGRIEVADLPVPPPAPPPPQPAPAYADATPKVAHGFHVVSRAMADTLPVHIGEPVAGNWAIQVGAFGNQAQARAAAEAAKGQAHIVLASVRPVVGTVRQAKVTLYRARLTGLSRDAAIQACERLAKKSNCLVVSPDAQS